MQLDPKTSMILNIVLFALQSLAGATWISGYLDPHWAGLIMGLLGWVTTVLNFVLHAYSPNVAGPLARSMLLIAAAGLALVLLIAPAGAQTKRAPPRAGPSGGGNAHAAQAAAERSAQSHSRLPQRRRLDQPEKFGRRQPVRQSHRRRAQENPRRRDLRQGAG